MASQENAENYDLLNLGSGTGACLPSKNVIRAEQVLRFVAPKYSSPDSRPRGTAASA
jgi:hypothetical protein